MIGALVLQGNASPRAALLVCGEAGLMPVIVGNGDDWPEAHSHASWSRGIKCSVYYGFALFTVVLSTVMV